MTQVWRTRGPAYHSRPDCPGIRDGQAEAQRKGRPTYPPEQIDLGELQLQTDPPRPCRRCWPNEPGWYTWLPIQLDAENHSGASDGSEYELSFLEHVLMEVDGLDPGWVTVQARVEREYGAPLRPDFVIEIPGRRPIALEVDGAQKTPNPGPDDRGASIRRDAELEALGYKVQHFTNAQITSQTGWCRQRVIELLGAVDTEYHARQPGSLAAAATESHTSAAAVSATAVEPDEKSSIWGKRIAWIAATAVVIAVVFVALVPSQDDSSDRGADPTSTGDCPSSHPVKGNVSEDGEKIFHEPGWEYYTRTNAEECFEAAKDAEAAGYRRSEAR